MSSSTIDRLRARVRGAVIAPEDDGYDEARRVYNALIDRRPAVIVRCANAADVGATIAFAREHDLTLAVRGGGHSVPGFGTVDGGVVADLGGMRSVSVDPEKRRARAEGGATWGGFDAATGAHGLATTGGLISTTGVAGLTLGGGIGHLTRGHGLSCDNLVSAEIVTADGRTVTASEDENADLFWAIRGGGGNFGVATALEFGLRPLKTVYGGAIFFDLEHAETVLRFYREFIADAPEALGGFTAFQIAPPVPFIPENRHGDTFLAFVVCWAGPIDEGPAAVKAILDIAPVVGQGLEELPYPAMNSSFDALAPAGIQHYWKANFVRELSDAAIEAHLEHGPKVPVVNSTAHIYAINGAPNRVAPEATAFAYRDAAYVTNIVGTWPDPAQNEANIRWVRDYYAAIAPLSEEGGYINFMAGDDQERIKANYRGNYERLVEVKRKWDPDNVFRMNQNIQP